MAQFESKDQTFLKRHKATLQTIALVLILVLPFVLYVFAQAGQTVILTALLVVMALVMVAIIVLS
ncbi:MAG: hypothetical protein A2Z14_10780 [Chloroflexi bacterium RBG_16_48_8]|nr:MAG: hypothetical protein A2Z14_10780 [Chloroflexi bacterium RBG_16_48_8]